MDSLDYISLITKRLNLLRDRLISPGTLDEKSKNSFEDYALRLEKIMQTLDIVEERIDRILPDCDIIDELSSITTYQCDTIKGLYDSIENPRQDIYEDN